MRRRRRRIIRRRRRWRGRGGMRRTCRTAWWWNRAGWSKSPWSPYHLSCSPASPSVRFFFAKKKVKNHIVEMPEDPASCKLCLKTFFKTFIGDSLVHFPSSNTCKSCGNFFWKEESFPSQKITCHLPLCPGCRPSATTVARTSQQIPACHGACRPSKILHARYLTRLLPALPSATLFSRQGSASSSR